MTLVEEGREVVAYLTSPLKGLDGCAETVNELCDRIEALERALREIELHLEAHPRPSQRTDNALAIARAALKEGDDWHYEGDSIEDIPRSWNP